MKLNFFLIVCIVFFLSILTVFVWTYFLNWNGTNRTDFENDADEIISDLIQSPLYQGATRDERKALVQRLLKKLKKEKKIQSFFFEEENSLYSFRYEDGTLGGVLIEDFNASFNSIIR